MDARALVGWNLRRLRAAANLTQEALGLRAGLEASYVGRIERGRENVTVGTLEGLARVLDVSLIEFFVEPAAGAKPAPHQRPGPKAKVLR
jgi:transcriptional regulator with XRE-family HTH domain